MIIDRTDYDTWKSCMNVSRNLRDYCLRKFRLNDDIFISDGFDITPKKNTPKVLDHTHPSFGGTWWSPNGVKAIGEWTGISTYCLGATISTNAIMVGDGGVARRAPIDCPSSATKSTERRIA